jgi:retron-type reverse transcriptase
MLRKKAKGADLSRLSVPMRSTGAEQPVVAMMMHESAFSEGVALSSPFLRTTNRGMNCKDGAKPFGIAKRDVWEAYKKVKANRGAAGIDGQSIAEFEGDLSKNLYKLWNRLASGSYFPPPVRRVEIPKGDGRTRTLGIPTVADRIAQMVVTRFLQPILEPHFHVDSYGYRPGKSAKEALAAARQRCWKRGWVLDLDIKAFFDTIDHRLLMRATRRHTNCAWVLLYVERWLQAPAQLADGTLLERKEGTPQGGVISPPWRISICIMRSIFGWTESFRPFLSSGTQMT